MSLNNVTLTGNLGSGAAGAWLVFTPTNWLFDATDSLTLPPEPVPVQLSATGSFSQLLLATDNTAPVPSGWQWQVAFSGIKGVPAFSYNFLLPRANGATQDISAIPAAQAVTAMQAYLPLPTGTPQAGQFAVVQANGSPQTAWESLTAAGGLVAANNLSDVASALSALMNLGAMRKVGDTGTAGVAKINGTQNILTWTAPNDTNQHRVQVTYEQRVTIAETGGAVTLTFTDPGGNGASRSLEAGGGGVANASATQDVLIAPNTVATLSQSSALTAGATIMWAQLWVL